MTAMPAWSQVADERGVAFFNQTRCVGVDSGVRFEVAVSDTDRTSMATIVTPEDALAAHLDRARSVVGPFAGDARRQHLISPEIAQSLAPIETEDLSGLEPQKCHQAYWRWGIALAGVGAVLLVWWFLETHFTHPPAVATGSAVPVDGLTIFAVFFVAALAIERLLEPFSDAILPTATSEMQAGTALRKAGAQTAAFVRGRAQRRQAGTGDESSTGVADPKEVDSGA